MMRPLPLIHAAIMLMLSPGLLAAQADLWKNVAPDAGPTRLDRAPLTDPQRRAVFALFGRQGQAHVWECESAPDAKGLLSGLSFSAIPVAEGKTVYLVEAGAGCARGGQGSNGAMWLVRFDEAGPVLLATPKEGFDGWLFRVQPNASHGYHDLILGWHRSSSEAGLSYFRFDGNRYRQVGKATGEWNENAHMTIKPEAAHR
jgi:hypothetical protein